MCWRVFSPVNGQSLPDVFRPIRDETADASVGSACTEPVTCNLDVTAHSEANFTCVRALLLGLVLSRCAAAHIPRDGSRHLLHEEWRKGKKICEMMCVAGRATSIETRDVCGATTTIHDAVSPSTGTAKSREVCMEA